MGLSFLLWQGRLLAIKLLVCRGHRLAQLGRRGRVVHTRLFQRRDLVLRLARATRDDGAGVAHPSARRGRRARDEAHDRLLDRLARDELGGLLRGGGEQSVEVSGSQWQSVAVSGKQRHPGALRVLKPQRGHQRGTQRHTSAVSVPALRRNHRFHRSSRCPPSPGQSKST